MTNRRGFLQTSAAVSAFAANGLVARSAGALGAVRADVSLHKVIYDDRYAEGRQFAATAATYDVPVRALDDGDVTRFWYDELDLLWRREPAALAGATQFGPMFVLERLAAERGMRVAMRVEHLAQAGGTLAHVFTAPAETLAMAEELRSAGLEWPALMAALVCCCSAARACQHATLRMPGTKPELAADAAARASTQPSLIHYYTPRAAQQGYGVALDGPLYSWVIAPVSRA
jgi:hypothetical protein